MTTSLTKQAITTIEHYNVEQRYNYLLTEVIQHDVIWILTDEHGCVMLNSDDEDCVPIWPHKEFVQAWATDEWQNCKAEPISLNTWHERWTDGLIDDELAIVIFPNKNEEGLVIYPDEFAYELKKKKTKKK